MKMPLCLLHVHHQFLVYTTVTLFSVAVSVAKASNDQWLQDVIDITASEPFPLHYDYIVTIDPDNEKAVDNKTCHPPGSYQGEYSRVPCKSLDYAFQMFHSLSSVAFYLASPSDTYYLTFTHNVTNQYNVGFYGNDSLYPLNPTVKCKHNVGLSFTNSSNIMFSNVEFFNCGSMQISTSKDFSYTQSNGTQFLTIRVGLYFYNCSDIKMYHVQVLNGPQATGVVMYDTDGIIEVKSCTFANNTVRSDGSQAGGGGFTVEFTYCKPGDITCNDTKYDSVYRRRNMNSVYLFDNCTFEENVAHNMKSNGHYVVPTKTGHDATGRGGGLGIFFKGDAMNNSVSIVDSYFIANSGVWGGGLRVEMTDNTVNNTVSLLQCEFDQNYIVSAKYGRSTGGGGMHIALTTHYWDNVHKNKSKSKIHIKDCTFSRNRAVEGGAICFTAARQHGISTDRAIEVLVLNSSFESNQGKLGSALMLTNFPIFSTGVMPQVKFCDCKFLNNVLLHDTIAVHQAEMAAIYISEVPVGFHNVTTFYNNTGTALVVVGSQVDFNGSTAHFEKNKGSDGGAIALLGTTSILIGPNTNMTFVDNTASRYGGAIFNRYISNEDLKSTADCFLRYTEPFVDPSRWKAHFYFSGNKAAQDGCSIFSTSVYPCLWSEHNLPQVNFSKVFRWNDYWKYENQKCEDEIYTEPKKFTFNNWSLTDPMTFFPGQTFRVPLEAWDDFDHNVTNYTVYSASVLDPVAEVDPGYAYITSNYIRITGEPGNNITLVMRIEGSQKFLVTFNLTILECPPGFVHSQKADHYHFENISNTAKEIRCECPPDNRTYQGHLKCHSELFKSKIDISYWYGPVNVKESGDENSTTHLMGIAPFAYRFTSRDMEFVLNTTSIDLPSNRDEVEETLCGNVSRRGVLCGECVEGYAVAVNSPTYECVPCDGNSTTPGEFIKHLCAYCLLYTSPSPRDATLSRMPSSA